MKLLLSPLGLALFIVVSQAVDPNGDDHSYLKVTLPSMLKKAFPDGVRHSQALFGSPSYGGDKKITGPLVYATPGKDETACDPYSIEAPSSSDPDQRPIFLVDRGACDFVQKMRIAQSKGAVAVIIADNVCQCDSTNEYKVDVTTGRTQKLLEQCKQLAKQSLVLAAGETCENGLPYMADDGTGDDIKIPSFLVDFVDAQPLKDCWYSATKKMSSADLLTGDAFKCVNDTKIVVQLAWDLPTSSDKVKFELWSSSDSEAVFKREFAPSMPKLAPYVDFQPRYFVWDGAYWGCTIDNLCGSQCTPGGLYCNPDPDAGRFAGVQGVDVVEENLREMCVWNQAKATYDTDGGLLWWEYVKQFALMCHPGPNPDPTLFNPACSKSVHDMIKGLSWDATQACVAKSQSDATEKGHNVLLDKELTDRKTLKILTLPTAIVNGDIIRGGVSSQVVITAICAGFEADKKPALCACVSGASSSNVLDCMQSGCAAGQMLCMKDKKCYAEADYYKQCALQCSTGETWCASTSKCVKPSEPCQTCGDAAAPVYCPLLSKCVADVYACKADSTNAPASSSSSSGGMSFGSVLVLVLFVTGIMGFGFLVMWRRQRAVLHDDMRSMLATYMPLDELDARGGVSTQATMRRTAPPPSSSQRGGQHGGSPGSDEASQLL